MREGVCVEAPATCCSIGASALLAEAAGYDIGAAVYDDVIFAFGGMADGLEAGAHDNVQLLDAGTVTTTDAPTTAAPTTTKPTKPTFAPTRAPTLWQLGSDTSNLAVYSNWPSWL